MAPRAKIDYARIEPEWRAGIKSVPQLAADYTDETGVSVSHTAINKHFKKIGVPRDLTAKVKARADALVSMAMVSENVSAETKIGDKALIDVNAAVQATIRLAQRKDIGRARALVMRLLAELEATTDNNDLVTQFVDLLKKSDELDSEKAKDLYNKIVSLPMRIKGMKETAETLRIVIALEREAYNIAGDMGASMDPVTVIERRIVRWANETDD